jgi:hypothetical protein
MNNGEMCWLSNTLRRMNELDDQKVLAIDDTQASGWTNKWRILSRAFGGVSLNTPSK